MQVDKRAPGNYTNKESMVKKLCKRLKRIKQANKEEVENLEEKRYDLKKKRIVKEEGRGYTPSKSSFLKCLCINCNGNKDHYSLLIKDLYCSRGEREEYFCSSPLPSLIHIYNGILLSVVKHFLC